MAVPVYTLAYHQWLYNQNEKRVAEQKKQHVYYVGNSDRLKKYLQKALEISYDTDDITEMQLNWVNLTKKVIDQMSVVYSNPADRYFTEIEDTETTDNEETETETPSAAEELTDYYWSILPDKIGVIDKKAHRYAKLSNVSVTLVLIDKEKKQIKYVIEPIYKYNIVFDDEDTNKIVTLSYPKYYKNSMGEDEMFTVVWTAKEHYKLDEYGNRIAIKDNKEMTNPYGKIPIAVLNFENGESWYGEGQNDLINVNEQLNVLLSKLVSNDIIYGSEGTDLAINLGLDKKGTIDKATGTRKVRRGRKHPIVVEDAMGATDKAPPSFAHVTLDTDIPGIRDFIDWYIKYIASSKGLNPSAVLAQLKDTSDYQKIMDSVDQMEMRKDDLDFIRVYEKERYEITKLVWNTHASELGMDEINDEGLEYKVDLAEIEIHKTPADLQSEFEFELKHNLTTPIDYMINKNPDLTEQQAEEIIKKNKKYNSDLLRQTSRLEEILSQNKITEPGQPVTQ
jgi:hypothetical protein